MTLNAIELSLFAHRLAAICEEMGAVLARSALSPNIKDREDFSCALFDSHGELVAQAAHIPVHLGSMAYCMRDIVSRFKWQTGDAVIFNDPFLGGTHLPDITIVMPVFTDDAGGRPVGFAASRAHHTDVGGSSAGSMGIHQRLSDEGVVLSPQYWFRAGVEDPEALSGLLACVLNPAERQGDLAAQKAACVIGGQRLADQHRDICVPAGFSQLLQSSEAYGREAVAAVPDGSYSFSDAMEDDGTGEGPFTIRALLTIEGDRASVDFTGTAAQSNGPVNCPLSVTAAAVFYVFRCLMPEGTPQTAAIFRPITLSAPAGCLVNARPGAAVAAGNVETSQRIVDVVLGALAKAMPERIPAASQGTMNNVIFAGRHWVYYETLAGGMGAHHGADGLSAVQCHMTNTRNTSIEVLEMHYPLRIRRYGLRSDSGGPGAHTGGNGLVREWEVLEDCTLSLLTERRRSAPFGLAGGGPGRPGRNSLLHGGQWSDMPAKCQRRLQAGDIVRIETPGGGGFGRAENHRE